MFTRQALSRPLNQDKDGLGFGLRTMSHLQFSRAILSRECATKSRDKVACAAIVQLQAATLSHK